MGLIYIDFKDGKYEGKTIGFINGIKRFETNFKNGEYEGKVIAFYPNGNTKKECNFKDGK
jgi:antitoxin component YwqK of YwqJK toxin-antitoxin module